MRYYVSYLIAILIVAVDQLSKWLAESYLLAYQAVPVMPSFNWNLMYNEGAAFSFLSQAGGWQRWFLSGLSLIVSLIIVVWIYRLDRKEKGLATALSLILGGAVGNLIDRVAQGRVTDFIQWYYADYYWPTFNVADSAISVGAVILLLVSLFNKAEKETH
ncbi:MAG: signal peptidase II [Gammaproteobacteria bacterium]|nr:signal peptidase II [Gammaproteobacteria bacterium]